MRAFLSSLPAYRRKVKKPGEHVRAKDLYDLASIQRVRSIDESNFWYTVGREFRLACCSRFVDCLGMETFTEQWVITSQTYSKDSTIPKHIDINEAYAVLERVVKFMEMKVIIPFKYPIPPLPS